MHLHQVVEDLAVAVEGEAQVAYLALLALFQEPVEHSVIDEALVEGLDAGNAVAGAGDGVQQIIIDIVHLQPPEGLVVHIHRHLLGERRIGVGQLGGKEIFAAVVPLEGDCRSLLRLAAQILGRCVEVVDAVLDGVVHQAVDLLLDDDVLAVFVLGGGPSHTSVTEDGDLVAVGTDAVGHFARGLLSVGGSRLAALYAAGGSYSGDCKRASSQFLEEVPSGYVVVVLFHCPVLLKRCCGFHFLLHIWR